MSDILSTVYHALFQHLPEGVLAESIDRRIVAVNRSFCEIFGLTSAAGDLVGADGALAAERWKALVADPGSFSTRIGQVVAAGRPVIGEPIRFADGRMYERSYVPIEDREAGFIGHLWQYRPVAGQRAAQAPAPERATMRGGEPALTSEEAMQYLKLSKRTLYRLIEREGLPTLRVGRQFRFRKSEIDAWLETRDGRPIS
jgi:excisionase family DNA binding protein